MPLDDPRKNPRRTELAPLQEISFMPSTIETIDRALFKHIDENINPFCSTNKGWKKVPFIWTGAERAYQIKHNKDLRDVNGFLIYPLISLERISITKDVTKRGAFYASLPPNRSDNKGGRMTVARVIKQDKTANFANADAKRILLSRSEPVSTQQSNFPKPNTKIVYETLTMPVPIYLEINYKLLLQTEYQQQVNEIITSFITRPGGINYFNISQDGHTFEVFVEPDYTLTNNAASLMEDARGYQTEITFNVIGYIIGGDKNDERPKIVRRENAVEVKMGRESVIFGDIPENVHISGNVPFYKDQFLSYLGLSPFI